MALLTGDMIRCQLAKSAFQQNRNQRFLCNNHSVKKVSTLDLSNKNLTLLDHLYLIRFIVNLNLSNNNIKNLSPLANLHQLRKLNLSGNQLSTFVQLIHLKKLFKLRILFMENTHISHHTHYQRTVLRMIPHLKFLDGYLIKPIDRELAFAHRVSCSTLHQFDKDLNIKSP